MYKNFIIPFFILLFSSSVIRADEWKNCDVGKSLASDRDAAIALGKIEKRIAFFKKPNFASITIFFDNQQWLATDLINTGRGQFGDGSFYRAYASKNNKIIVQEFEEGNTMIVTAQDDIKLTFFANCK